MHAGKWDGKSMQHGGSLWLVHLHWKQFSTKHFHVKLVYTAEHILEPKTLWREFENSTDTLISKGKCGVLHHQNMTDACVGKSMNTIRLYSFQTQRTPDLYLTVGNYFTLFSALSHNLNSTVQSKLLVSIIYFDWLHYYPVKMMPDKTNLYSVEIKLVQHSKVCVNRANECACLPEGYIHVHSPHMTSQIHVTPVVPLHVVTHWTICKQYKCYLKRCCFHNIVVFSWPIIPHFGPKICQAGLLISIKKVVMWPSFLASSTFRRYNIGHLLTLTCPSSVLYDPSRITVFHKRFLLFQPYPLLIIRLQFITPI